MSLEQSTPSSTLTFMIADVRGYTAYTHQHGDEAGAALATHFATLAEEAVATHGGRVVEVRGDEVMAVFAVGRQALRAAVDLHVRCAAAATPELPLRAGIGLDVGEPVPVGGGYRGEVINVAARLCARAAPGEVLASESLIHLARRIDGLIYEPRGEASLKGLSAPLRIWLVRADTAPTSDPEPEHAAGAAPSTAADRMANAPLPGGGYLGAVPAHTLVARDEELARLIAALAATRAGQGRCVLLAGEPGVGKTRLAQEVSLRARAAGFLVLVGRCTEQDTTLPFAPFLEPLAIAAEAASPALRGTLARHYAELGLLVPAFGPTAPLPAGEDTRRRIVAAADRFLAALAAERPLALLLDDLHWADSASLELLDHLAHALRGAPVLLLGAYRDVEVGRRHPLEATLTTLLRDRVAETIVLRGLQATGTGALICTRFGLDQVSDELRDLVHARTEGNPFFTEEVLAALVEQGAIYREGAGWGRKEVEAISVPQSIRSVVGQRVGRLSHEGQELLTLASVLGQEFDPEILLAAAGGNEEVVLAQLDAALAARLLEERRVGREDRYAFAHALIGQVLYDELPRHRLRRLHLRAGEALERARGGRAEVAADLARHFLLAGETTKAARYALAAGDRAADLFAHAEALGHYEAAADLLEELGDRAGAAAARRKLGMALHHLNRMDEALQTLATALDAFEQLDDRAGQAAVEYEIGAVWRHKYDFAAASAHYAAALRLWPEGHDAVGRAYLLLYAGLAATLGGDYNAASRLATQGLALAEEQRDPALLALALNVTGTVRHDQMTVGEAIALYDRAAPLARQAKALHVLQSTLNNRAFCKETAGELEAARDDFRQAIAVADAAGTPHPGIHSAAGLTRVLEALGEWEELQAELERAGESGFPVSTGGADTFGVQGDHEKALARLYPMLEEARRHSDMQAEVAARIGLAERYLELSRLTQAEEAARAAWALLGARGFFGAIGHTAGLLAEIVARNDAPDAEEVLDEARARVARYGQHLATPRVLLASGLLLMSRGDHAAALASLNEGAAVARGQKAMVQLARLLQALAQAARMAGDEATAGAADEERRTIIARIGPRARDYSWAR